MPVCSEVRTRSQHSRVGDRRGHFDAGILAGAHGGDGHPGMPIPRRGDDDRIEIRPRDQRFPGHLAAGIDFRGRPVFCSTMLRARSGAVGQQVADGADVHLREQQQDLEQAIAARAHADDAQANAFGSIRGTDAEQWRRR